MKGKNDFKEFANLMYSLAGIFDSKEKPTALKIELYFKALEDLTIKQVSDSITEIILTRSYPNMPLPAHIRENANIPRLLDSLSAWNMALGWFEGGAQPIDPVLNRVVENLGGYEKVSRTPYPQLPWLQKDFERIYNTLNERRGVLELTAPQTKLLPGA